MDERRPNRKRIRLDRDAYSQPNATWLVSLAVKDRPSRPFADPALAAAILDTMLESAHGRLDVFAAVVMPDHVHLLVAPTDGNLVDHVSALKSATTRG